MKKYSIFLLIGLIISSACCAYLFLRPTNNIAFVDLATVYDSYPLKKELEAKLTNVQQARKNILDSLKIELNALSLAVKSEKDYEAIRKFQIKKNEYSLKQQTFEEDNLATTESYSSQIWKQINQYVKDYGKASGYTFILGTDGSGTVMYAEETKDVTTDVSAYINKRFNGEGK
jgi:outer membrane protein